MYHRCDDFLILFDLYDILYFVILTIHLYLGQHYLLKLDKVMCKKKLSLDSAQRSSGGLLSFTYVLLHFKTKYIHSELIVFTQARNCRAPSWVSKWLYFIFPTV